MNAPSSRPAVFLDRDGTINVDKNYVYQPADFEFISGAPRAIRRLNDAGWLVVVVTNQAGVARGLYREEDISRLHDYVDGLLRGEGARVDAYYYCPDHPHGVVAPYNRQSHCRKPNPGMYEKAIAEHDIDAASSWAVGDKNSDMIPARGLGATTILVRTGYGTAHEQDTPAHHVVDDLSAAVDLILGESP